MADIADAAGIPRPTLYEYVAGREQLIDLVLVERIREIGQELKSAATGAGSFSEALVATSVEAIMYARSDREITNIFSTAPNRQVHEVLEGPNPEVASVVAGLLGPVLEMGRSSGELRDDVPEELIVSWVRAVYTAFILRDEVDRAEVETMIRAFLLPSLQAAR
jgi:AcrR family transcriptional regulator